MKKSPRSEKSKRKSPPQPGAKRSGRPKSKHGQRTNDKPQSSKPGKRDSNTSRNPQAFRLKPIPALRPFGERGILSAERFEKLLRALQQKTKVIPRGQLASSIEDLVENLTKHRGKTVRHDYLNDRDTQLAYLAHYLPWNIVRLAYAFSMSSPQLKSRKGDTLIEDWGSGPLTTLLALWMCDQLPEGTVTFRAREKSAAMLRHGRELAQTLGVLDKVRLESISEDLELDADPGECGEADVLFISHALNEWLPPRGRSTESLRLVGSRARALLEARKGSIYVVEPASRVISWGVMALREILTNKNWHVIAPCTHHQSCPLLSGRLKQWCHFRREIRLEGRVGDFFEKFSSTKRAVSLSLLQASTASKRSPADGCVARVISDGMRVANGVGHYACGSEGLLLIEQSTGKAHGKLQPLGQGEVRRYALPKSRKKDKKSGALRAELKR